MSKDFIKTQQEQDQKLEALSEIVTSAIDNKMYIELYKRLYSPTQFTAYAKNDLDIITDEKIKLIPAKKLINRKWSTIKRHRQKINLLTHQIELLKSEITSFIWS